MAVKNARARRQQRYRDRLREMGLKAPSGKHTSLFEKGEFVAVDGEGFNSGPAIKITVGENNREYTCYDHHYALLSASDGSENYNPVGRLTTKQCLDFLLDIKSNNRNAICVCFGASYDMCHMLAFGLQKEEIHSLLHGDGNDQTRRIADITLGEHDYRLELRPRKSLSIWRWNAGDDKYEQHRKKDGSRIWRMTKCDKVILWDVWGFFQGTFAEAMKNWLHGDPDYEFIKTMKGERSLFERSEIETIRRYNQAELRCLVAMMDKVREAVRALDLSITRWDGAGAIAGAMLKHHGIKDHMEESPLAVFEAARRAYSGGHIEACKIGHHDGAVHHYDVNSAYPDQFRHLPSLRGGSWTYGEGANPPEGFTMVKLAFRFKPGLPFYPLFYRQYNGSILYPERGCGWYWWPEYLAGLEFQRLFGAIEFKVMGWWYFKPQFNIRPFAFIEDYYQRRKQIVEETRRTGIPNGEEKTLKLGYNSVYGKAAQQVGARWENGELIKPAYFQLEYAGYVTAGCRAKLMMAAMQRPADIISFATDGLFSLSPLELDCPADKVLGAWEYQRHDGMTMVMPGVYWLHDGEKTKHYSRGFDKKTMSEDGFVRAAWAKKQSSIDITSRRLVTLGTALMSDNFWQMRGLFTETVRTLQLNGANSKRYPVAMHKVKLHREMVANQPQDILEDYAMPVENLESEPYPIDWLKEEDAPELSQVAELTDADRSFFFDREAMMLV